MKKFLIKQCILILGFKSFEEKKNALLDLHAKYSQIIKFT